MNDTNGEGSSRYKGSSYSFLSTVRFGVSLQITDGFYLMCAGAR